VTRVNLASLSHGFSHRWYLRSVAAGCADCDSVDPSNCLIFGCHAALSFWLLCLPLHFPFRLCLSLSFVFFLVNFFFLPMKILFVCPHWLFCHFFFMILHLWGTGVTFCWYLVCAQFHGSLSHEFVFAVALAICLVRYVVLPYLMNSVSSAASSPFLFPLLILHAVFSVSWSPDPFWFDFLKLQVQDQMIVWQTVRGKYYIAFSSFPFLPYFCFNYDPSSRTNDVIRCFWFMFVIITHYTQFFLLTLFLGNFKAARNVLSI
jgi:hypothetical protein